MKFDRRVVAVGAVVALTLGTPTAAFAGPKSSAGKKPTASAQKASAQQAKAEARRAEARKKAAKARAKFTFPGTVTAVTADTITISRKQRGVVVAQTFVVPSTAVVKRDDARTTLSSVAVGDHAVAKGAKVDGELVVSKLNVDAADVPAVTEPATPTATIVI